MLISPKYLSIGIKGRIQHRPVINNSILQGQLVSSLLAVLVSFEEQETTQADELKMKVYLYTQMTGCVRQLPSAGWHPDISSVSLHSFELWGWRIGFLPWLR